MRKKIPYGDKREFGDIIGALDAKDPDELIESENRALEGAVERGLIDTDYAFDDGYLPQRNLPFSDSPNDPLWGFKYVQNSLYRHWVEPYTEGFGEAVRIVFFEDFVRHTEDVMKELLSFVGLSVSDDCLESPGANRTVTPSPLGRAVHAVRAHIPIEGSILDRLTSIPAGNAVVEAIRNGCTKRKPSLSEGQYSATRKLLAPEYEYWFAESPYLNERWCFSH
jgi:hypothetical protein